VHQLNYAGKVEEKKPLPEWVGTAMWLGIVVTYVIDIACAYVAASLPSSSDWQMAPIALFWVTYIGGLIPWIMRFRHRHPQSIPMTLLAGTGCVFLAGVHLVVLYVVAFGLYLEFGGSL
jgi:hypothetical protein